MAMLPFGSMDVEMTCSLERLKVVASVFCKSMEFPKFCLHLDNEGKK